MKKILILGNGFDLHHGLKTTFTDFRDYTKENNSSLYKHINNFVQEKNKWSNIENDLLNKGHGYFVNVMDEISENSNYAADEEYDSCEPSTYENTSFIFREDMQGQTWLPSSFNDTIKHWITIQNQKGKSLKAKVSNIKFSDFDVTINFNYTTYWENLYGVKENVYYPHGNIDNIPKIGYTKEKNTERNHGNDYAVESIDFQSYLKEFNKVDWKFIEVLESDKIFRGVCEAHFFGFSFGEQDWIYIHELYKNNGGLIFSIYKHNDQQAEAIEQSIHKMIKKYGMKNFHFKIEK